MAYVVANRCYGGFGLSIKGLITYCEKKYGQAFLYKEEDEDNSVFGKYQKISYSETCDKNQSIRYWVIPEDKGDVVEWDDINNCILDNYDIKRDDPALIATIRELGEEANGRYANLEVVEIPDDVQWVIREYDGWETIEEKHRSW